MLWHHWWLCVQQQWELLLVYWVKIGPLTIMFTSQFMVLKAFFCSVSHKFWKIFYFIQKKRKKLKSFITSFLLWETHIKYSTSWETNNLLYSYTVWTDLQRKFDSFLSVLGVHCHQCYLFKRSTYLKFQEFSFCLLTIFDGQRKI